MAHQTETVIDNLIGNKDEKAMMQFYDNWSENYDQDLEKMSAEKALHQFAQVAAEFASNLNCRVIDICAGTGLSGVALQQSGFTNIDAIDGSSGMLDIARSKNIYKNLYHELIGDDTIKSFPTHYYDLAFAIGAFAPGHLGPAHLRPIIKSVTRGGHVIISIRERWLNDERLAPVLNEMQKLQDESLCQQIEVRKIEKSLKDRPASVFVFQVL